MSEKASEERGNERRARKRATSEHERLQDLVICMTKDTISTPEKIKQLRAGLYQLTGDVLFKRDEKDVGGNILLLAIEDMTKVSPIPWKSKQIERVYH